MAFGVNRFFRRRYGPAWLTLGLGLAASAGLSWQLHREAVALDQQRFKLEAYHIAALLESTMERYEERVGRLADHCAPFDELPTQIWNFRRSSMTDLDGNLPNVVHAVYCLKIPATGFEAHATRGREKWKGGYAFDPQAETGRAIALPVWQYWSRQGFEPVVRGSDMAQEADWHPSLLPALTTARGWISPSPVRVKRADGKATTGFWFALALFKTNQPALAQRPGESLEGFSQRRAAFIRSTATGMLAVFISTDRMLDDSYNNNPQVPHRLHARLYTSREPMVTSLLNPVSQAPVNPRYYEVIVQSWYGL